MFARLYYTIVVYPLSLLAAKILFSSNKKRWVQRYRRLDGSRCLNLGDLHAFISEKIKDKDYFQTTAHRRQNILKKALVDDNVIKTHEVFFENSRHQKCHARYYIFSSKKTKKPGENGFILLCFGACTTVESKYRDLDFLQKATGKCIVGFNYPRGSFLKNGCIVEAKDLVATAVAVLDGLHDQYKVDYGQMIPWGFCIGSWVAYHSYRQRGTCGAILDHAPTSLSESLLSIDLTQIRTIRYLLDYYCAGMKPAYLFSLKTLAILIAIPAILLQLAALPLLAFLLKLARWDIGCAHLEIERDNAITLCEIKSMRGHPIGHCLKLYQRDRQEVAGLVRAMDHADGLVSILSYAKDGFLDHHLFPASLYHKIYRANQRLADLKLKEMDVVQLKEIDVAEH